MSLRRSPRIPARPLRTGHPVPAVFAQGVRRWSSPLTDPSLSFAALYVAQSRLGNARANGNGGRPAIRSVDDVPSTSTTVLKRRCKRDELSLRHRLVAAVDAEEPSQVILIVSRPV